MRSIWMASAALLMTAGIACAQTSSPTGAPTGATPGETAPTPAMQPPTEAGAMAHPTHHWAHKGSLPENARPVVYLHIAKSALKHQDYARADDALSHAETRLLTRTVVQSSNVSMDRSPAVTSIEHARHAAKAHDQMAALNATDEAIQAIHMHHRGQPVQPGAMGPASTNMNRPGTGANPAASDNNMPQTQVTTPTSSPIQPVTPGGDDGTPNPAASSNSMPQNQVTAPTTAVPHAAPTAPAMQAPQTN